MKKHLLATFALILGFVAFLSAQERYIEEIFDEVTVTENVVYGNNISIMPVILGLGNPAPEDLFLDIYEPAGDTVSMRPVVIFAHRGDFLPPIINQSPYGSKQDSAVVELCTRLAKMGFVTVAIDYRLGWNPFGSSLEKKSTILQAAYRVSQDLHTAVRFFRKDAAENGNTYKVHSDKIAVGGFDAAVYGVTTMVFLKDISQVQIPKFLDFSTVPPTPFVFQERDGDPYALVEAPLNLPNHVGYTSEVSAFINMRSGLADYDWITAGDPPAIAFSDSSAFNSVGIRDVVEGTSLEILFADGAFNDTIVTRSQELGNQDVFINGMLDDELTQLALERSGDLEGLFVYYNAGNAQDSVLCLGSENYSKYGINSYAWNWYDEAAFIAVWNSIPDQTIPGEAYVCNYNVSQGNPNDPALSKKMIDTLQHYIAPRLALAMDLLVAGVDPALKSDLGFNTFPNPVQNQMTVVANEPMHAIRLFDASGRLLEQHEGLNQHEFNFSALNYPPGLYVIKARFKQGVVTEKIIIQ